MAFKPGKFAGVRDRYSRPTRFDAPVRVTVICYLLLSLVGVEVVQLILVMFYPKPDLGAPPLPGYLVAIGWTQTILLAVSAWFMLKGHNWARIMFFVLCAIRLTVLFVAPAQPDFTVELQIAVVMTLVLGGFLVTRPSNSYFRGMNPLRGKPPPNSKVPDEANSRRNEGKYNY